MAAIGSLRFAAGTLGIKASGDPDAALFLCAEPANVAGVFTSNAFVSACIDAARDRLHAGCRVQALLITSGNANAGTGMAGRADTEFMAATVAQELGCAADEVLVLHTGVIGVPLQADRYVLGLRELAASGAAGDAAANAAADAMRTTDTRRKCAARRVRVGDVAGVIAGVAKGSGMIHPRLATMIAVIATDFHIPPGPLQTALVRAVRPTFNSITVDGDTSPNDAVILLSAAGPNSPRLSGSDSAEFAAFVEVLTQVCDDLARQIVADGEGATKFIEVHVSGAATDDDAEAIAVAIATSPLVKTACYGGDFNPGRIVAAIGRSGAQLQLDRLHVTIGGISVFRGGAFRVVAPDAAAACMANTDIAIGVDVGLGSHERAYYTCDLTPGYVQINSAYTS